jgi:hypothetical protein
MPRSNGPNEPTRKAGLPATAASPVDFLASSRLRDLTRRAGLSAPEASDSLAYDYHTGWPEDSEKLCGQRLSGGGGRRVVKRRLASRFAPLTLSLSLSLSLSVKLRARSADSPLSPDPRLIGTRCSCSADRVAGPPWPIT